MFVTEAVRSVAISIADETPLRGPSSLQWPWSCIASNYLAKKFLLLRSVTRKTVIWLIRRRRLGNNVQLVVWEHETRGQKVAVMGNGTTYVRLRSIWCQ